MAIRCCYGCVSPKRHPGCHGECQEYIKEKAEHDEQSAEGYRKRQLALNLNQQKYTAIIRASKNHRKHREM